jgi:hypothetical protein
MNVVKHWRADGTGGVYEVIEEKALHDGWSGQAQPQYSLRRLRSLTRKEEAEMLAHARAMRRS